ncbi:Hydroxylase [Streptomyces ambofaciens ATCC 23877]|uniref:Hydroxylase n=1 Tax=Streptomyces ambofaciens (strain ATCC 23877 / 3486 / DSM 40053 / JCM 4204 / NBRC 12836 / NRRL B-2516) TaxID=278992 RepID=A0A0K2B2T3_STRA7|nr:VOC family protein [Streptomyces ambofaciens]AKZ59412.1 Hydroxylase [Streptomyces ambofaciens ATCC 23877]
MLTTRYVTGAPNWIEVGTSDVDGATSFYGGLFGWRFRPAGPEAGGYGFFELDGRSVAGARRTAPEQGPPSWTVYFQTHDAAATAEASERARGGVLVRPADAPGQGTAAILTDRTGARFGLLQPGRLGGLGVAGDSGALCWVELYTADVAAAAAYYHAVLGLETSAVRFPGAGTYTCVNPAGEGEESMFGGVVPLAGDPVESEPHWLPYFAVDDTDAAVDRAGRLGGSVRMPAADIEGVGRLARLADPYGARFAVLRPSPREL